MQPTINAVVYIVDDDSGVRDALAWLLRTRRIASQCFESAEAFVAALPEHFKSCAALSAHDSIARAADVPSCLVLDMRMPGGMSGLALFNALEGSPLLATLPVLFLTGHADLPTAVDAVKRGAFDFLEKPFSNNTLVDRIEAALAQSHLAVANRLAAQSTVQKVEDLTERERGVMQHVVAGLPNKLIAEALGISVRTVEVHRARVFEKMNVKSAVELANLVREIQV